eukprot:gene19416-23249_t
MNKFITIAIIVAFVGIASACSSTPFNAREPTRTLFPKDLTQQDLDFHNKNMQIAIDLTANTNNCPTPSGGGCDIFTAVITHNETGEVMCTGKNNGGVARFYHGEISAMKNCSELHPTIKTWENYNLYTTGESCPMCHAAAMWMGFNKVIYGTSIIDLYCKKCMGQIAVQSDFINAQGYALGNSPNIPQIIGGILANITDTTVFVSYCNTSVVWNTNPICNKDYTPTCISSAVSNVASLFFTLSMIVIAFLF